MKTSYLLNILKLQVEKQNYGRMTFKIILLNRGSTNLEKNNCPILVSKQIQSSRCEGEQIHSKKTLFTLESYKKCLLCQITIHTKLRPGPSPPCNNFHLFCLNQSETTNFKVGLFQAFNSVHTSYFNSLSLPFPGHRHFSFLSTNLCFLHNFYTINCLCPYCSTLVTQIHATGPSGVSVPLQTLITPFQKCSLYCHKQNFLSHNATACRTACFFSTHQPPQSLERAWLLSQPFSFLPLCNNSFIVL